MVIQPTFTYRNSSPGNCIAYERDVTRCIECGRLMRMDAGRPADESGIVFGDLLGGVVCIQDGPDADDALSARAAGALYYRVAVAFERAVAEVRVAVEEARVPTEVWRGHLRSIQRRRGPAT